MAALLSAIGLRGTLMGVLAAAVGFLVWDYRSTKNALREARQDLFAKEEELRLVEAARDVAIEFGEKQAERAQTVKTRTIKIRKRPDGKDPAAAIILDTINSLRGDTGGVSGGAD